MNATSGDVVAVVIPVHNAESTIAEQLEALSSQVVPFGWEVVLVLNRCTDRTLDVIGPWVRGESPRMIVVHADQRAGASYARNVGARATQADVLVFCDADDVVGPDWLNEMVSALEHADVVGGRLSPLSPAPQDVLAMFPVYRSQQASGLPAHGPLSYPMTASMSCLREAFDAAGGFDESFVHGCDDVVFSLRAQQAGYRLGFAESALCWYRIRGSLRDVVKQRKSYTEGNIRYAEELAPFLRRSEAFEWLMLLMLGLRALFSWPPTGVNKWWIHARVQRARIKALRKIQVGHPLIGRKRSTSRQARPMLLADLGRNLPRLRRLRTIDRAVERWKNSQPLVDFTVPVATPCVGGLGFLAPFDSASARSQDRNWSGVLSLLDCIVRQGDAVVDVGAGYGLLSVAAARSVGPGGSVLAIEPTPKLASALECNLERHAADTPSTVRSSFSFDGWPWTGVAAGTVSPEGGGVRLRADIICLNHLETGIRWTEAVADLLEKEQGAAVILPNWAIVDLANSVDLYHLLSRISVSSSIWMFSHEKGQVSSEPMAVEEDLSGLVERLASLSDGPIVDLAVVPVHRSFDLSRDDPR